MSNADDFWNRDISEFFKKPDANRQERENDLRAQAYIHRLTDQEKHPPVKFNRVGFTFLLFGVIVPICMITIELVSHVCAHMFFDPLPTFGHVLLVSLIPVSNALFYIACRQDMSDNYAFMTLSSGMAMGVGIMYTLMLLPCAMSPLFFAFLFVMVSIPLSERAGKGICTLADLRRTSFDPHQTKHLGHLIILVAVVALELPSTLTRIHLADATKSDDAKSLEAIKWLRENGNQDVMLRACYEHSGRATDIVGTLYESRNPIPVEAARNIYYRVTGKPFNSVAIPSDMRATMQHAGLIGDSLEARMNADVTDEFDLDPDIAGENVSGVARGLTVSKSTLTGKINNELALAEMTLEFELQNSSEVDREARAKILLPAGGVVDSAYIIADLKKREAVIQERSQARAAYRASVEVKRDPLLISECGTDEVLMQCYPVKGRNKMFVSLHMVAPVMIDPVAHKATLALPTLAEKNFQADVPVDVRIEATAPVSLIKPTNGVAPPPSLTIAPTPVLSRILNQKLTLADLSTGTPIVSVAGDKPLPIVCESGGTKITNTFCAPAYRLPERLHIVIDGSAAMKPYIAQVVTALRALPETQVATIDFAGDKSTSWTWTKLKQPSLDRRFTEALATLSDSANYAGGQDCSTALENCLLSMNHPSTDAILWIHAAQPIVPKRPALYTQDKRIYDMQVSPGPDTVRDLMYGGLTRVATAGNATDSLTALFDRWNPAATYAAASNSETPAVHNDTATMWLTELQAKSTVDPDGQDNQRNIQTDPRVALAVHIVSKLSSLVVADESPQMVAQLDNSREFFGQLKRSENMPMRAARSDMPWSGSEASQPSAGGGGIAGDMFKNAVGDLNSLSATAPAAGFVAERDALSKDQGSYTSNEVSAAQGHRQSYQVFGEEKAKEMEGAPASPSVSLAKPAAQPSPEPSGGPMLSPMKSAPQLQGTTNGTISPQEDERLAGELQSPPLESNPVTLPQWPGATEQSSQGAFREPWSAQSPGEYLFGLVAKGLLILLPILTIACAGVIYGRRKRKK